MTTHNADWPHDYGKCHCGCGKDTWIPSDNDQSRNRVKGRPVAFIRGHEARVKVQLPEYKLAAEERFWARLEVVNQCWEWTSPSRVTGYGFTRFCGRRFVAHRLAWLFVYGYEPADMLCHSCDNPLCCNPGHLWEGGHRDNMADMRAKGRGSNGLGERTHCQRGHPLFGPNLYLPASGGRHCKACAADGQRARRLRKKALVAVADYRAQKEGGE